MRDLIYLMIKFVQCSDRHHESLENRPIEITDIYTVRSDSEGVGWNSWPFRSHQENIMLLKLLLNCLKFRIRRFKQNFIKQLFA